ncbi:hypothetical protein SNL152K_9540 [Streptomyces sp. NL15-2K]|nr:hypothetical protein SNL152K_9540 [Streptomyces sp. NL15-2K]
MAWRRCGDSAVMFVSQPCVVVYSGISSIPADGHGDNA